VFRKEFDRFDADGDKLIDVTEFGKFLRGIGLIPNDDEVRVGLPHAS
jgi:Ca2+-binding EF-hand superfamily protein